MSETEHPEAKESDSGSEQPTDHASAPTSTALATPQLPTAKEKEERNWALCAHLSSLSSFIGIPGFVGPLVVWLVKKDELPFASEQAKEALNFQITLFIYGIICVILIMTLIGALIGLPGLIMLGLLEIIFTIIAAIQAGEGKAYRYPLIFRFIT